MRFANSVCRKFVAFPVQLTSQITSRWALIAIGLLASFSAPSQAQVSRPEAGRLGLELAWQSQIQLPPSGGGLVTAALWADMTEMHAYAVVELPDRTIRISAEQADRKGLPIGLAEAKKLASEKAGRLMGGAKTPIEVLEVNVPQLYLVLVSHDGMVQCLNAETGVQKWATACGRVGAPTHEAAVSKVGVTVVQGTDLYLLDWKNGNKLMIKPLRHGTSNAVSVCNDIAFVSDFSGQVEAYGLGRTMRPWSYQLFGHAVGHPVTTADQQFTAIATDKGYAYVMTGGENPQLWLRFEAASTITGSIATANNSFYVGSMSGVLSKFSLENRFGNVDWEFPIGKPITEPTMIANGTVFLATEPGDLIAIDDADGVAKWKLPRARISRPISIVGNHIICVTNSRQLMAIDTNTGSITGTTSTLPLGDPIPNTMTDRVYVVNSLGNLQCLRAVGAELPTMHTQIAKTADGTEEQEAAPETDRPAMESASPFDAFGTGDDPFGNDGGGSDPFGDPPGGDASGDPFGDPFGSGTEGDDADPFDSP